MIEDHDSPGSEAKFAPAVYAKYGEASVAGFQAVPDLILKRQTDLGLSSTDVVVLLNVLMHWWYPAQKPFPRPSTIAKRMGLTKRTVQRSLQRMEELKLLAREKAEDGRTYLDPSALVAKLEEFTKTDTDYLVRRRRRDGEEPESNPASSRGVFLLKDL